MEQKRDKKMQFRLTEEEQKLITDTLKEENISEMIRIYLLQEVQNRLHKN